MRVRVDPARFAGAPLDAIKLAAAVLMVGDHVDTIRLDGHAVALWRLGRVSFPLFCLAAALHLARGAEPGRYVLALLLIAVPTQGIYGTTEGSILFTLAAGTALAAGLARAGEGTAHLAFAADLTLLFVAPALARTGVDFGMPGIPLIPTLRPTLARPACFGPWLAAVVLGLNWHGWHPRGEVPWLSACADAATVAAGLGIVLWAAARVEGRSRFLPSHALQIFYPAHLPVLLGLRAIGSNP